MSTAIFDTLQYAKRLKEAGVPEKQAEVQAEALREIEQSRLDELATKQDLKVTKQELKQEIALLREELKGEIKLLKWMMGAVLAGIVSLVLKTFFA
ncbi:MAG: DUF1640 domain-containing protein [Dissulfurispiraceae bacterium]|jgi:FKBP-type peptidyl-prolyl cis-trans isomerase (trigger factor)